MFDQEPQDIFAGTDKAPAKPAQPQPRAVERASVAPAPRPAPAMAQPQAMSPQPVTAPRASIEPSPRSHFLRNVMIILFAVVAVGVGAYLAYALMIQPILNASVAPILPGTASPTATKPATTETPASSDATAEVPVEAPVTVPDELNPTFLDSDGDGLNNAAELEAGTSSTNPDTDGDGLGDREEVKVYSTDPNRTDTDGDGYLDGAEVAGGYNPNGPGMLLQIPTTP